MVRRLPWGTSADDVEMAQRKRTAVQRGEREKSASSDGDMGAGLRSGQTMSPMSSPSKVRSRNQQTSRTPSTSPPPAPPPTELMREGYHADDISMMVEDEFHAVAQTFTHHLHHAEYIRVKNKARTAPAPAVSQPVNGLRADMKKQLEANDVRNRQNIAIKSMIGRAGRASPDEEEQEEQGNDPWKNTSLAGLMAKDNTQKRRALVGSEQIQSATRAAKGFSRSEGDSATKRTENRSILEIYGGKNRGRRSTSPVIGSPIKDAEMDEGDGRNAAPKTKAASKCRKPPWLDTQEVSNKKACVGPVQTSDTLITPPSVSDSLSENVVKARIDRYTPRPSSKLLSGSVRKTIDSFDDFHDPDSDEITTRSRGISSRTRKPRSKNKGAKEKDDRSHLAEIPTFLV